MKTTILLLIMLFALGSFGQTQNAEFNYLGANKLIYSGDYNLIYPHLTVDSLGQFYYKQMADPTDPLDGVNLRYLQANFIDAMGTDSLVFNDEKGYLYDYRAGTKFDSVLIQFQNITLKEGDTRTTRTISIEQSTTGAGNHLTVKAGADDDGQGGGNLYLQGGGGDEFGDVYIGSRNEYSTVYVFDTLDMGGLRIKNLAPAVNNSDAVTLGQLSGLTKNVYSISLPYATTVQGRVNGAVEGTDYETGWTLAVATNQIDLVVTHGFGRRVAEVNVLSANGTIEQLLRPFAGAYSGWQTNDTNTLQINSLATTPLPLVIYIIFE